MAPLATHLMLAAIIATYLAQLVVKIFLALRYRDIAKRRASPPTNTPPPAFAEPPATHSSLSTPAATVSILQPILSGDPALADTLRENLAAHPAAHFFWLVTTDDSEAARICETLAARFSETPIKILRTPPPPQGVNPKVFKLTPALDAVTTPFFVVLDDDTRLSVAGLRALIAGLENGAALSTGLPRYHAASGRWSAWLAEFVNSAAVLAYLPPLALSEPVSIHGMCYAMCTGEARELDVFRSIERMLTDDLALALLLQKRGLRICQTVEPHDIATSLASFPALLRILHRWFVFTRLLLAAQNTGSRLAIAACHGLPPLLLWSAIVIACCAFSPWSAALLLVCLAARECALRFVARVFLGSETARERHAIASLCLELAQPVFLVVAVFKKTIRWRNCLIRVRKVDDFEYL